MSQDSREKFGVKSQISTGGGGGEGGGQGEGEKREQGYVGGGGGGRGGREKERKERKDMLKAGQSRGSILCVNGVMHYKA